VYEGVRVLRKSIPRRCFVVRTFHFGGFCWDDDSCFTSRDSRVVSHPLLGVGDPGDACDQPLSVIHADNVPQLDEVVGGEANPRRFPRKLDRVVVEGVRGELGASDQLQAVAARTMLTHCASAATSLSEAEISGRGSGSRAMTRGPR
jgi:hypothetical protein